MTKYKGLYIDHVFFHCKADIDNHLKNLAIQRFKILNELFANNLIMEYSIGAQEQAEHLHDTYKMSWEEIENIEIETFKSL